MGIAVSGLSHLFASEYYTCHNDTKSCKDKQGFETGLLSRCWRGCRCSGECLCFYCIPVCLCSRCIESHRCSKTLTGCRHLLATRDQDLLFIRLTGYLNRPFNDLHG